MNKFKDTIIEKLSKVRNVSREPFYEQRFQPLLTHGKRLQLAEYQAYNSTPEGHKFLWSKRKKRRKTLLQNRKKEGKYHPKSRPKREAGFAAYRYDENEIWKT